MGFCVLMRNRTQRKSLSKRKQAAHCAQACLFYIVPYKGTNWFSITHELVKYVLDNESIIRKQFYHTVCADEVFLHSIAMESPYRDTVVNSSLRAVDWTRGTPYVYKSEDVEELLDSENLFGRKFDERVDPSAIEKIVARLS